MTCLRVLNKHAMWPNPYTCNVLLYRTSSSAQRLSLFLMFVCQHIKPSSQQHHTIRCSILGSLSIEDLSMSRPPASSVRSLPDRERGTMDDLSGRHIAGDHMHERVQEHDPARTDVVYCLWIVNCSVRSPHNKLTCYTDLRFTKVQHKTFISACRHKFRQVFQLLSEVDEASGTKSHWTTGTNPHSWPWCVVCACFLCPLWLCAE